MSPENQTRYRWAREVSLAGIYADLGHSSECVAILARMLKIPGPISVPILRVDPVWDNVRDDPCFQALLADPKNSAPL